MNVYDYVPPLVAERLRASSLLSPFAQSYLGYLREQRYAIGAVQYYLSCLSHFTHWAASQQFELPELPSQVHYFLYQHLPRCRCIYPVARSLRHSRAALQNFIAVVIKAGVKLGAEPFGQVDEHLQQFEHFLEHTKGLANASRKWGIGNVRPLVLLAGTALPTPDQLRQFLSREQSRLKVGSIKLVATAVRCYLRWRAFHNGESIEHLLPLVMSPANWRLAALPKTLTPDELKRLLDAFPPGMPSRLRAFVITL